MTEKNEEQKFIVAYDFLNPQASVVLGDAVKDSSQAVFTKINTNSFIGRGILICECRVIESLAAREERCCEITIGGKKMIFETTKIIECLPVIEGAVAAGIYRFYQQESNYYQIKNAAALSKIFDEEPNFDYENKKFVCRPDRISLYDIKTDQEVCSYERHPLTFFDVHCPLCRQKVMTYKTESDCLECEELVTPCPHFVGNTVWSSMGYETEALDDLNINHRFTDDRLYFETAEGWQQPTIYAPPHQPLNSIWDGSGAASIYADHFFFVESEPVFSIE